MRKKVTVLIDLKIISFWICSPHIFELIQRKFMELRQWKMQDAKNQLSKVIDLAMKEGLLTVSLELN